MRIIIRWIFLVVNFIFIICALIAIGGSSISPERFLIPAYFTLVFPYILLVNVLFVLFWLIFRRWFFVFSLALLILSYPKLKIIFPINIKSETKEISDNSFTLMTYNTWYFCRLKKHTVESPNEVIQHVLEKDADIVCLQEFVVMRNHLTEEDIVKAFKKYPYNHIYYKSEGKGQKSGIATFSKYPIVKKETIDMPSEVNSVISSDIVIGKDTIRLINCHLESNRLTEKEKSMPLELRKNFDMESLSNVTRHLSGKLGTAYKTRAKQAEIVAKYIQNSPYKVITCGDFNDVPLSYSYTKVKGKNMQDVFEVLGCGLGNTFHENLYNFRIDYILCDQNFIPLQFELEKVDYSDHYPLTCRLEIKARP